MQPYIMDLVQAHALFYIIPDIQRPDILISETLKPGPYKELQVSIVSHLISQCKKNTVLIPGDIKIDLPGAGNLLNSLDVLFIFKLCLNWMLRWQ
jgi:hypothetical protein